MRRPRPTSSARHLRVPLFAIAVAMTVLSPLATPPARAQAANAADAPRITADAARCLAIDQDIAALTVQQRAGTITAEQRKARADALAAERKSITDRYPRNTPENRTLVAEYNRLKTEAALAARNAAAEEARIKREAAAAEAQAKREAAAAEAQAKRDAITREQQARRDAAAREAAEKARLKEEAENAVMAAAGVVADERLQRQRDQFYREFGLIAPNDPAIVRNQEAMAKAARDPYVAAGAAPLNPSFDQRVQNLVQLRLPERRSGWFAEVFPSPQSLLAQFDTPEKQSAAFGLAWRRLADSTTGIRAYAAQQKLQAYEAADPKPQKNDDTISRLMADKAFEAEVFAKSLPAYSAKLRAQVALEKRERDLERFREGVRWVVGGLWLAVLVLFIWFPLHRMSHQKFGWKRQKRADWEAEVAASPLPENLRWIEVAGFRYPVTLFSGQVFDKEIWTETNTTTTTTTHGGNWTGSYYTPTYSTTSTHVSSTTYHRYWLYDTSGKKTWQKYSDNEFLATAGDKVSTIWSDQYWSLCSYNHGTATLAAPAWWTKTMHRPPYWSTFFLTLLLGLVAEGATLALAFPAIPSGDLDIVSRLDVIQSHAIASFGSLAVFLFFYVAILRPIYVWRRQRQFRNEVLPKYQAFLQSYEPTIPEVMKATS